jgi:hypothetical protein
MCFCADSVYGQYGVVDISECNLACAGASNENCGGLNRNMVYSLAPPDGIDPCIDGGNCILTPGTPQAQSPPNDQPPPQQNVPTAPNPGEPVDSQSEGGWDGFGGLGLIISIVIIALIVIVVAVIIGVTIWLVKKKEAKTEISKWEMY